MKDLKTLSDEELIAYYKKMQEVESTDYTMDGSGECGHLIARDWEPIGRLFETEFEKREIPIPDSHVTEMPL